MEGIPQRQQSLIEGLQQQVNVTNEFVPIKSYIADLNQELNNDENLDSGILFALEEQVRKNICKYELTDEVVNKIVEIVVYKRQENMQKLHEVSEILRTTIDDRRLQMVYVAEFVKIIADIEKKLSDKNYIKTIYNQAQISMQSNPYLGVYLFRNLIMELNLLKNSDKDRRVDTYFANYSSFISPEHNDEWQKIIPDDEHNPKIHSTALKGSESMGKKILGGKIGQELETIDKMKDLIRTTFFVDDLDPEFVDMDKDKKLNLIGNHINFALNKLIKQGYQISIDFTRKPTGYSDIKILVTDPETNKKIEYQVNSMTTFGAKKLEEKEGLYAQRKDILVETNNYGIKKSATMFNKRADLQDFLAKVPLANNNGIIMIDIEKMDNVEYTQQKDESFVNIYNSIIAKAGEDTVFACKIGNFAFQYQQSMIKSQSYFTEGSIMQSMEDAQVIVSCLSPELQECCNFDI